MLRSRSIILPDGAACLLRWGRQRGHRMATRSRQAPDTWGCNAVLAGTGAFRDASGRWWPLRAGDVFLRQPGVPHATRMDPGYAECWWSVDAVVAGRLEALGLVPRVPLHPRAWTPAAATAFARLGRRADLAACVAVAAACHWRVEPPPRMDRVVAAAQAWMAARLDRRFSIAAVGAAVGLSAEGLRKRFRRHLGQGVLAWAIDRRMELASRLLADHPVGEVARRLGYGDPFTFSDQFARHTGQRPGVLRRLLTASAAP
jgi:AraC-like DNA-binding protein